jgi:hypothetical protein
MLATRIICKMINPPAKDQTGIFNLAELSVMKGRVGTILLFVTIFMVRSRPKAKSATRAAAHAHATTTSSALTAFGLIGLVSATGCSWPRRALERNRQVGRDGIEIERLANEGAQRYDQFLSMDEPAGGKLVRGARGQPDLFLGAEEDDVG